MCAYAQGFSLLKAASDVFGWNLDYGAIARIFRGGCIIRARFLNEIATAYEHNPNMPNLLTADYFRESIGNYQDDWRTVISTAVTNGLAVPAFSSALAYYDSYRTDTMPVNLLQAQRDYFGAHTYQRIDREGVFHTDWIS
jgi:6-phosphogluconate dehydrogenase